MEEPTWTVLLIEDDEEDFILTRETLSEANGSRFKLLWASTYYEGQQALMKSNFDVILMDYELGPHSGLELIHEANRLGCKAPIILLTGRGNYEVDVEAMKSGATDYMAKSEVTPRLLERTIRYAILSKQTEEALKSAKEELELRVRERTHELIEKNEALIAEIMERRKIEGELAEVRSRLLDRVEAERRELARDLHDGPMQDLYGIIFTIDSITKDEKTAQETKNKLLQVVQELRAISRDLRPPTLAPYGLQKAIQSHLENLKQDHPKLKVLANLMPDGQILPEPARMALFRIYQMAITNVLRHAKASEVSIDFFNRIEEITLTIKDNGCGFNVPDRWIELARQGHLGLVGAAERAEAIGGS